MPKLLYIEASPRKARASSIAAATKFLDTYKSAHPNNEVVKIDLWKKDLPAFDGETIEAKYSIMNGQDQTESQKMAWKRVVELIDEFKNADAYLFSLPMWNFGVPYKLKHYIDVLVQPGLAFSFSPTEGFKGLITGKKAVLIYARGGVYSAGSGAESLDFQDTYMKTILQFIGFTDIINIFVEPTTMGARAKEQAIAKATEEAIKVATSL
jgi:FMN-dependent NADH-azoreductase